MLVTLQNLRCSFSLVVLLALLSLFFAQHSHTSTFELKLFNFKDKFQTMCDDPNNPCYSVMDLVERALRFGLDSQEHIQLLFQAKAAARIKMGLLLPRLDPINAASAAMDGQVGLDSAARVVGFLFPSRWFDYKSAKALRQAQEESIAVSFANVGQAIMEIYYQIQMQVWSIRILNHYIYEARRLIDYLKQLDEPDKKSTLEDIAVLESIRAKLAYELAFIDSLSIDLPRLASFLGLDPNVDWASLNIEEYPIFDIPTEYAQYQDYWQIAQKVSPELKNIDHLLDAAKEEKRSAYFQFLDPLSAMTFGYGYGYNIKIARSNLTLLHISKQKIKIQLSLAIQNALNNYNDSISAFPAMIDASNHLIHMKPSIETHINDAQERLDINRIARYFEYASGQALRYISSYFIFRTAEAELNRYIWHGDMYDLVIHFRLYEVPKWLKEIEKKHSFRQAVKRRFHHSRKKYENSAVNEQYSNLLSPLNIDNHMWHPPE